MILRPYREIERLRNELASKDEEIKNLTLYGEQWATHAGMLNADLKAAEARIKMLLTALEAAKSLLPRRGKNGRFCK